MYMPRIGVYGLVFDISRVLGVQRATALAFLDFWINSINVFAAASDDMVAACSSRDRVTSITDRCPVPGPGAGSRRSPRRD